MSSYLSGRTSLTSVATDNLEDGAVTTAKIADSDVTLVKTDLTSSTTAAGLVELSTSAENLAGTATTSPTVASVREMTSLVPQNIQAGNYTTVLLDQGKHIYHASDAGASDTYTIPANASVAYPLGTALTFISMSSATVAIAITSDTLYLATDGTTGSRTLAQYGVATAIKMTATTWIIAGSGLT